MQDLLQKSYDMGYMAYPERSNAPYLNVEFMGLVPGDFTLRNSMYEKYIKGWTRAYLDDIWEIE
jgi:hypothetical protein